MTVKLLEIRDKGTCIPALAIRLDGAMTDAERWLLARAGYGETPDQQAEYVLLMNIDGGRGMFFCDPYDYDYQTRGARTMPNAHLWLLTNFDNVQSGDVVDVRVILGEAAEPAPSDRLTWVQP